MNKQTYESNGHNTDHVDHTFYQHDELGFMGSGSKHESAHIYAPHSS